MNKFEFNDLTNRIDIYCESVLSRSRYEHSVRVAVMAQELCVQFGVDPYKGYVAGLAHDMCKSGKEQWLLALSVRDDAPVSQIEADKPSLLHGRAASILLAEDFGVSDFSILEAVKHHTFGFPNMDALSKVIFVSDKIEPGRTNVDPFFRERVLAEELDGMVRLVLLDNIAYLQSRQKEVASITLVTLASLDVKELI